jgi:hypothetical protein
MQIVAAPNIEPFGPWVEAIIATPDGTFQWPPERYGWGAVVVKCKSPAAKDEQKAAGRRKAKTKKSGPQPIPVTMTFTFTRTSWEGEQGMGALLAAIDPNNPNGAGGPFDFQAADFSRRGGKSIDIDEVGEVDWKGHYGTCTVTAKEWVPEPPKEVIAQNTETPSKSTEYVPGTEGEALVASNARVTLARSGIGDVAENLAAQARRETVVRIVAERGFDGPETPTAAP